MSWIDGRYSRRAAIRDLQARLSGISFDALGGTDSSVLSDLAEATGIATAIACEGDDVRGDRRTIAEACGMLEMFVRESRSTVTRRRVQPEDWLRSIGRRARMVREWLPECEGTRRWN